MSLVRILASILWAATLSAAVPSLVRAQDDAAAGSFIIVAGEVKVIGADGLTRMARRGDAFRSGEAIVTGKAGLAQLRMTDGSAVSVRADTHLKLDQYRFRGKDDPEPTFLASLVKGGLRTITGLIGRLRRDNYRVATVSTTLGIRGTHFELVHVVQQTGGAQPGTYNRVYEGVTVFRNLAGVELLVSREQTAFVPIKGNLPPVLVRPPAAIFGKPTPEPIRPETGAEADDGTDSAKAGGRGRVTVRDRKTKAATRKSSTKMDAAAPATSLRSAPLLTPLDSTTTTVAPTRTESTTISPTLISPLISPTTTTTTTEKATSSTTTISPTLTDPSIRTTSPTLTSPTTTISPTTTTISPTLTTPKTTISPTTTTISPSTTTISPTLTSPTTTIKR